MPNPKTIDNVSFGDKVYFRNLFFGYLINIIDLTDFKSNCAFLIEYINIKNIKCTVGFSENINSWHIKR